MRTSHSSTGTYEIRVQGRLEPRWAAWFGGFVLAPGPSGTTVLTGTVVDQAALHGLLQSLRDLGLPLVSVTRTADEPATALHATGGPAAPPTGHDLSVPASEESR